MNSKFLGFYFALAFLLVFCPIAFAQEIKNPVEIQSVKAKVTIEANGTLSGDLKGKPATIKVLGFRQTESQQIWNISEALHINGKKILGTKETDSMGNNFAVFQVNETGNFNYAIEAEIETNFSKTSIEEYDLQNEIVTFKELTLPTELVESNDSTIMTIAFNEFTSNSLLETIRSITEWTHNYIEYDESYFGSNTTALQALQQRKGVCSQYAELAAAFLRAKKIPARFAVGTVFSGQNWGNHAWLQAFNPNSGWIDIDPTYGEAGIVDGTHIVMGFFADPSNAADTITAATTANSTLGQKEAKVELLEIKKFFGIVEIKAKDIEEKANEWFDLNYSIKNISGNTVFTPALLNTPKEFLVDKKEKVILLKPNEEKEISAKAFAKAELEPNQYLEGEYNISAFAETASKQIKIRYELAQKIPAKIELKELTPIVQEKQLVIQAVLENTGTEQAEIKFSVKNSTVNASKTETIEGLEKKRFFLAIGDYEIEKYTVKITGPGLDFEKEIELQKETKPLAPQPNNHGNNPVPNNRTKNGFPVEITLIAAIVIVLFGIGLMLKSMLK